MEYVARLATRLTPAVDQRLRMLVLAKRRPLSHVLDELLDQVLPPADKLATSLLVVPEPVGAAPEPEAA